MNLAVRPLHPLFAGEVSGVDVGRALDPGTVRALTKEIDRYAVLVFHDASRPRVRRARGARPAPGHDARRRLDPGAGSMSTAITHPPRYPPITYGEYRVWWLNTNYGAKLDDKNALPQRTQRMR